MRDLRVRRGEKKGGGGGGISAEEGRDELVLLLLFVFLSPSSGDPTLQWLKGRHNGWHGCAVILKPVLMAFRFSFFPCPFSCSFRLCARTRALSPVLLVLSACPVALPGRQREVA